MEKPILDLSNPLSWNIAFQQTLKATPTGNAGEFYPIRRQNFLCPSNILLIGSSSTKAKSSWWLGCRVSVNLSIGPPDSSSKYTGIIEVARANVGLNQLKLFHWQEYEPKPYVILLFIPWWLEEVEIEAYWYDGPESSSYEELLKGIDVRTINIEREISLINNNGTDSNTDSGNDGTGGI
ncbi:MAG: hypothetical protein ACRC11_08095 [Xenococcaceae cyanobacterium]